MWFLPVGSVLIPPRRVPGEAGFTPRTLTRPAPPHHRISDHATQPPQRQQTRAPPLAPAPALALALSREPPREPRWLRALRKPTGRRSSGSWRGRGRTAVPGSHGRALPGTPAASPAASGGPPRARPPLPPARPLAPRSG